MRRTALLLSTAAVAVACAAPSATDAATIVSTNWAGYAATGRSFERVTGSWTVQRASCDGSTASSATWVGLGGFSRGARALEQTGTEVDCSRTGRAYYSAWWELVPQVAQIVDLRVRPGDQMSAAVSARGHRVTLSLVNRSTGASMRKTATMSSPDVSSADWIVEAPEDCTVRSCRQLPLADFGGVDFSGAHATDRAGRTGAISDSHWSKTALLLRSRPGAVPSRVASAGTAFSVVFRAAG